MIVAEKYKCIVYLCGFWVLLGEKNKLDKINKNKLNKNPQLWVKAPRDALF